MKLLKAYRNGELLFDEVENANHFFSRFMGLMFRRHIDDRHALLLSPCDEIHTFFMKFDIDAVAEMFESGVITDVKLIVNDNTVRIWQF